ncbi:AAA family ATPase [Streptomyces sp. NPDC001315]|uniref:helix-turn-helix transcriptional regulator n=1 Tax=Streptomyces sp. NPDC001315 TaxID=3364562 RepID=UPI0036B498CE
MESAMAVIGREAEKAQLSKLLHDSGDQALVLTGEAGIGKSALLGYAAGLATRGGHRVIAATAVEAEAPLSYATLRELLHPLVPDIAHLERGSRVALDAVYGQPRCTPPSTMTLGIAVLDLLSAAASKQPLLLILDDAQWLDHASAAVCSFVGHRLAGSGINLLVAARSDLTSRLDTAVLAEMLVGALAERDAEHLLDRHHPSLRHQVRHLVLKQALGNPLALLELPPHVDSRRDDLTQVDPLGQDDGPMSRRLHQVYGARISALGDTVRAELLKGALDGAGARPGNATTASPRYRMRHVEEAVACGLLLTEPATGSLAFRHPLVRSSVVQLATPNQRRAAHRALAEVHRDDIERRAAHLAAATVDPDEGVADVLESAAKSATERGGILAAVEWLTRAAELSEGPGSRGRRLSDAAFLSGHAMHSDRARRRVPADCTPGSHPFQASIRAAGDKAQHQDGAVLTAEAVDALGVTAQAARAQAELNVAGGHLRASSPSAISLNRQERRIADLAASGLTNGEIGDQVHLSPRAVSVQLYRIFPKLGVTSRVALRDALARLDELSSTPSTSGPVHETGTHARPGPLRTS